MVDDVNFFTGSASEDELELRSSSRVPMTSGKILLLICQKIPPLRSNPKSLAGG
jgi:hypothetical protein